MLAIWTCPMKDDFNQDDLETRLRRMRTAEADMGLGDGPAPTPLATWLDTVAAPGIDMMRALWMPNWRK
jgi:hypothetical protein